MLARLIQAAEVRPTDVVLVVGCTTGYAGAVLARLAGTVILVEPQAVAAPVETLLDHLGVDNVVVVRATIRPRPSRPRPYDVILLAGSFQSVPPALLEQIGEPAGSRP